VGKVAAQQGRKAAGGPGVQFAGDFRKLERAFVQKAQVSIMNKRKCIDSKEFSGFVS